MCIIQVCTYIRMFVCIYSYIHVYAHTHKHTGRDFPYILQKEDIAEPIIFSLSVNNWHPSRGLTLLLNGVPTSEPYFIPQLQYYQKLWTF